ncbi:aminopeptidase P family protein [Mycoplasma anserisalpingitidis]|uniref:aminopeptidase P family protein n=1 Tax=Mycoplasma anserisalpingitidis TaxID=519450 RepID=UPI0011B1755B|nr:aminopeptidase P family protein [Mycoplasma anserisalpingitidis]QDY87960.1 aminopeptidase P family protein [Mycoplasma anserisalpingitidis]UCU26353.1 aminopeptidase P family protein [Mycoplasma anserisalpingitidis]UCU27192.1 aminopeptidase P family protein [Mycoplasma anserisalpingitidis]
MNRSKLEQLFETKKIDAYVSEAPQTRLWYAGVQTTDGVIIIERNKAYLFVDGRYIEYVSKNAKNVEVKLMVGTTLKDFFEQKQYKHVAYDENYLTKATENWLNKLINPEKVTWINAQQLRINKSEHELELMQKTIDISLKSYEQLMQWVQPGMTEKEVAAKLNYLLKLNGAEKESFDEIIAAGASSAEPHHHPTDKKLEFGSLLKVDFGALYKGYSADITRTSILGGEENVKDPKMLEILNIVKEAARLGRAHVKPGIKASEVDKVCRDYIESKGYGKYFVHSTGHGLGIDVHELPSVSKLSETILEPGMIITVEPGIYIEGLGGARIEDDVLVTETGHYVFSRPDEK